jgi:hypothetical protein
MPVALTLRRIIMLDAIYVGLIVASFISLALYAVGCEKL